MKFKQLVSYFILISIQLLGQQSVDFFAPLDATIDEILVQQTIPNTGNFNELVIPVGFSDRGNAWPVLTNSTYYPLHGVFPNGILLKDSITQNSGAIQVEDWYEPMLDDYFNTHSNNLHTVDFEFVKRSDGKPYTPDYSMAQWIVENDNVDTNIICDPYVPSNSITKGILTQVAENMYADNPNVFNNINAIHFVFNVGRTNKREFNTKFGVTIINNISLENNNIIYFEGPITINWKIDAIPHERLHLMGLQTERIA